MAALYQPPREAQARQGEAPRREAQARQGEAPRKGGVVFPQTAKHHLICGSAASIKLHGLDPVVAFLRRFAAKRPS